MSRIYESVSELVGRTPLMELKNIESELSLDARLLAKLEYFNPAGSVKDRVALNMINQAEESGKLKKNSVIIEPTSGNTGIGLASIAASRGYRVIIVMPDTMSIERRMLMKAYGAELVLTPGTEGMKGAIRKAEELAMDMPDSFIAGQFANPANPDAHYNTTGPEIYSDTDGNIDMLISAVGTGGTISGVGRYLKERIPSLSIIAVEPDSSAVLSGEKAGSHKIQGIGAGFIPEVLDTSIYDEIVRITNEEAFDYARLMGRKEGILVGISSGAALAAGVKCARMEKNKGKTIVVIFPDTGERYLSTSLLDK